MNQVILTISENKRLSEGIFRMTLSGDTSAITAPGQFIDIRLPGRYLRRPLSVCDAGDGYVTIIYKILGHGTSEMSEMTPGTELNVLTGLGNGYDTSPSGSSPLLIGGGVGLPPMYLLAKELLAEGKRPSVIMGFNRQDEIFYLDEFRELGCDVSVSTADGSFGTKGFVTDVREPFRTASYIYTCGPIPMLKAVYAAADESGIDAQFSFEERMGCGFGACMGCSIKTKNGFRRVCKDGPVFRKEEILWED